MYIDMDKNKKMNWYDVKLYQFEKLQEITKIDNEEERLIAIAELLLGEEVTDLPLKDFNEACKQLSFLKEEVPCNSVPPKKVEINGRKYYIDSLLGNITTTQYIDYTNHAKEGSLSKMLSVFIIPEGHKYNDGYDMLQVFSDIDYLPIPIINSIAFFFERQLNKFIEIFQSSSIKKIKKLKFPKETKEKMIEVVKRLVNLVLSHSYSNSVK